MTENSFKCLQFSSYFSFPWADTMDWSIHTLDNEQDTIYK